MSCQAERQERRIHKYLNQLCISGSTRTCWTLRPSFSACPPASFVQLVHTPVPDNTNQKQLYLSIVGDRPGLLVNGTDTIPVQSFPTPVPDNSRLKSRCLLNVGDRKVGLVGLLLLLATGMFETGKLSLECSRQEGWPRPPSPSCHWRRTHRRSDLCSPSHLCSVLLCSTLLFSALFMVF